MTLRSTDVESESSKIRRDASAVTAVLARAAAVDRGHAVAAVVGARAVVAEARAKARVAAAVPAPSRGVYCVDQLSEDAFVSSLYIQ